MRATLRLSSPAWLAQPKITSSIFAGSIPERRTTSAITSAARSSGRTSFNAPPYRPTGVRTASKMTADLLFKLTTCDLSLLAHFDVFGTEFESAKCDQALQIL